MIFHLFLLFLSKTHCISIIFIIFAPSIKNIGDLIMDITKEEALKRFKQLLKHKKELEERAERVFQMNFPEDFVTA